MVRHLTSNHDSYQEPQNPFASELDQSSDTAESSLTSSDRLQNNPNHYQVRYNTDGYYLQDETTTNLLSPQQSTESSLPRYFNGGFSSPLGKNFRNGYSRFSRLSPDPIRVPPENDRYPHMAGPMMNSLASLNSQTGEPISPNALFDDPDGERGTPTPSPAMLMDYSPFGGYPASSFPLHIDEKEPDDYLHNPDPIADAQYDKNRFIYDLKHLDRKSASGLLGVIGLFIIAIVVFVVIPVLTYSGATNHYKPESYEILTNYRYPISSSIRTNLVDKDTPDDAHTFKSKTGDTWKLVFSEEFKATGRSFYQGDDQFFEAVDLHYDATKDLEWYDPDAVTTANGTLVIRMDAVKNHDLFYRSGMVQTWNKMCFTQGMIQTSVQLPNYGSKSGLWPGLWTMGNLGRPGYLASTEGVWPYTYDSCDAGITPNQSSPDGISYLPGQRLNACTCKGEDHPNRGTGRGAPEIDIIEAEVDPDLKVGVASQSYQIAPMDVWYYPDMNFVEIENAQLTAMNTYTGGPFQQAVSGTTTLNGDWYERGSGKRQFQRYGFEYLNDNDSGHLTWYVGESPTLTLYSKAMGPNGNVGSRMISKEPMSAVMNFGMSNNWAFIDWPEMIFPSHMRVAYLRIYQPEGKVSLTCDPEDYPTVDYIELHKNAYMNANLTSWKDAGYSMPKNSIMDSC